MKRGFVFKTIVSIAIGVAVTVDDVVVAVVFGGVAAVVAVVSVVAVVAVVAVVV